MHVTKMADFSLHLRKLTNFSTNFLNSANFLDFTAKFTQNKTFRLSANFSVFGPEIRHLARLKNTITQYRG